MLNFRKPLHRYEMDAPVWKKLTQKKFKLKDHELSGWVVLLFVLLIADLDHLLSDIVDYSLYYNRKYHIASWLILYIILQYLNKA